MQQWMTKYEDGEALFGSSTHCQHWGPLPESLTQIELVDQVMHDSFVVFLHLANNNNLLFEDSFAVVVVGVEMCAMVELIHIVHSNTDHARDSDEREHVGPSN